jgi:hypothetical protein
MSDSKKIDQERLAHAWECIIPNYLKMCSDQLDVKGPGVSIFRMFSQHEMVDGDKSNCAFNYTTRDSPSWKDIWEIAPNKDDIFSIYDPVNHLLIAVFVSAIEGQDETIGNIRVFEKIPKDGQVKEIEV